MKIIGKSLAWAIIHLILFIYFWFVDFGIDGVSFAMINLALIIFCAWRFIENMKLAFGDKR